MKRFLFFLLINIFIQQAFAAKGIVLVLEAPMMLAPKLNAPISMFVRKGQKIFIHDKNISLSPLEVQYDTGKSKARVNQGPSGTIFLQAIDTQGRPVWIEKRFVKIIYQDEREMSEAVSPFEYDPKDYRIYEPIPKDYPFYQMDRRRLLFTYGLGSGHKTNYAYLSGVAHKNDSSRHGLNLFYLNKVDFDLLDRFYYGVNLHLYGENNIFTLTNGTTTTEFRGQLGVGPIITYDAFKRGSTSLTFTSSLTLNYDRTFIKQEDAARIESEERIFQSLTLSPKFGTYCTFIKALPFASIVIGSEMQFNLRSQVNGSKNPVIEKFWNPDADYIQRPLGATFAFYIGIIESN